MTAIVFDPEVDFAPAASAASFDEFMTQYQTELYQYALHLTRRRADADGLYLETFLKAFGDFDRADGGVSDRARLYRIATSTFLGNQRPSDHEMPRNGAADHVVGLDDRDLLSEVEDVVDGLPVNQRVALILRKYQGLNYDEIAVSLDTNQSAAQADVHQALRTLHEHFANRL